MLTDELRDSNTPSKGCMMEHQGAAELVVLQLSISWAGRCNERRHRERLHYYYYYYHHHHHHHIPVIPFTNGIYSYVPQTNPVPTLYTVTVAAVLYLQLCTKTNPVPTLYTVTVTAVLYVQSVLHVMLFPTLNMFCAFTSALPQCTMWLFFAVP